VADLCDGDSATECVKQLQRKAEMLVEEHALLLRSAIEERDILEREAKEIRQLSDGICRQTQRMEELKSKHESSSLPEWLSFPLDEPTDAD